MLSFNTGKYSFNYCDKLTQENSDNLNTLVDIIHMLKSECWHYHQKLKQLRPSKGLNRGLHRTYQRFNRLVRY